MKKLIKHIKKWNKWRKKNTNGPVYKILVFFNLAHSPTFALTLTNEEERILWDRYANLIYKVEGELHDKTEY